MNLQKATIHELHGAIAVQKEWIKTLPMLVGASHPSIAEAERDLAEMRKERDHKYATLPD